MVARQPIFNSLGAVVGYELLYREEHASGLVAVDSSTMSARTIVSALVDIGLTELVGNSRAWINLPESALVSDAWAVLDRSNCVIEVLETVPVTGDTVEAIKRLVSAGFDVALDDYVDDPDHDAFLQHAKVVKLDVLGKDPADLEPEVKRYRARGLTVLAERVENEAAYQACRRAGFELFQGYYFARPELVSGRRVSPQVAILAEAVNRLGDEEFSLRDLERVFLADPTLTLKLLQIANSAAMGNGNVESIKQAIALVGRATLRRWLTVMLAACGPQNSGEDTERFRLALERARFAELVAEQADRRRAPAAFLSGLLSMLDALLGVPLDEVLALVNVSPEVRSALLDRIGPLAGPLLLAEQVELGLWESAAAQADAIGFPEDQIQTTLVESARWARRMRAAL